MSSKSKDTKKDSKGSSKGGKRSTVPDQLVLRGLHRQISFRNIYAAVTLSLSTAFIMYFVYNRRRINKFRDYYANFDADAMFERIASKGRLVSAPPPEDNKTEETDDKKKPQ